MNRSLLGCAIAAMCVATPALAADYPELRPAYEPGWESGEDSLRFEGGLRYWYSWGSQEAGFPSASLDVKDQTQAIEVHTRIDDLATQTYLKGMAGLGVKTTGDYTFSGTSDEIGGKSNIGYIGADFGYMPLGDMDGGFAGGAFAGYQYWNDSPDIGRGDYVTGIGADGLPSGGASAVDNLDIHALRLGLRGTAELGSMFDLQVEAAAVPYAHVTGTLGPHEINGVAVGPNTTMYKSSPTSLSGMGYGAMGEAMVGFHPTENFTVRFGGRAWYMQGALDATFDSYLVTDDGDPATAPVVTEQSYIQASDYARLFRYGALVEVTGRF